MDTSAYESYETHEGDYVEGAEPLTEPAAEETVPPAEPEGER